MRAAHGNRDSTGPGRLYQMIAAPLPRWREDHTGDEGRGAVSTGYALVGTLPRERLLALAEAIYRQGTAQ